MVRFGACGRIAAVPLAHFVRATIRRRPHRGDRARSAPRLWRRTLPGRSRPGRPTRPGRAGADERSRCGRSPGRARAAGPPASARARRSASPCRSPAQVVDEAIGGPSELQDAVQSCGRIPDDRHHDPPVLLAQIEGLPGSDAKPIAQPLRDGDPSTRGHSRSHAGTVGIRTRERKQAVERPPFDTAHGRRWN